MAGRFPYTWSTVRLINKCHCEPHPSLTPNLSLILIPSSMSAKSPSPPSSPRVPGSPRTSSSRLSLYSISQAFIRMKRIRDHKQIESSSGQQPITHPSLVGAVHLYKEPINRGDQFICVHGVDLPKLLRASRLSLLNQAKAMGANVLVDEKYAVAQHSPPILIRDFFSQVEHNHFSPEGHHERSVQSSGEIPLATTTFQRFSLTHHRSSILQAPPSRISVTPADPLPWIKPRPGASQGS